VCSVTTGRRGRRWYPLSCRVGRKNRARVTGTDPLVVKTRERGHRAANKRSRLRSVSSISVYRAFPSGCHRPTTAVNIVERARARRRHGEIINRVLQIPDGRDYCVQQARLILSQHRRK